MSDSIPPSEQNRRDLLTSFTAASIGAVTTALTLRSIAPLSSSSTLSDVEIASLVLDPKSSTLAALDKRFGSILTPEMFGAAGDGTSDDTTAFQSALDAAADGHGKVSCGGGIYSVTSLRLSSGLHIDLTGSTLRCRGGSGKGVLESPGVSGGQRIENIVITGGTIDSSSKSYSGISLENVSDARIEGVRFVGLPPSSSTGIRLGKNTSGCHVIRNVVLLAIDEPFGTVASSVGISCESVTLDEQSSTQNSGLVFDEPTEPSEDHVIAENAVVGGTHGIALIGARYCTVKDNRLKSQSHRGMIISQRASQNIVRSNVIQDFDSTGIHLVWGSVRNLITENVLTTNRSAHEGDGIKGYFGCSDNVISLNLVSGAANGGIRFAVGSSGNLISGNRISDCKTAVLIQSILPEPYEMPANCPATTDTSVLGNILVTGDTTPDGMGIVLEQQGNVSIRGVLISSNRIKAYAALRIVESGSGQVSEIDMHGNSVATEVASQMPRGIEHFGSASGNGTAVPVRFDNPINAGLPDASDETSTRLLATGLRNKLVSLGLLR